ncbi:Thermostable carboxypeptidase 1 [Porphyridium purpureum]|uniref:Thermostable carboxypeptidase 1 n=1 Tax=Porphyridium purpureum TaxID=35688 RepID=A0A5J4YZP3_PORPP|nr:Thermostable carboxypeptidase 1 [Porphyridium purpureum]|eukprot:POR0723..scf209_3
MEPGGVRDTYERLCEQLRGISRFAEVLGLLSWDEQTMMAPRSSDARGKQKAALSGALHEKMISQELGDLLDKLRAGENQRLIEAELNAYERANVRDAIRTYDRKVRMPAKLAEYEAELFSRAYRVWSEARKNNDFASWAPVLKEVVDHVRHVASITKPEMKPYDAAIDDYEREMSAERLAEIFGGLKKELQSLLNQIAEAQRTNPRKLPKELDNGEMWDVDKQAAFCKEISEKLGFDFSRGRLDVSVHPFTGGAGPDDVRITTRYSTENWVEGIAGTIHEVGHARYEQNRNPEYAALPVQEALSMGVHESQSLFWERCIGQSLEFWEWALPIARKYFPHLENVEAQDVYYRLNIVTPSLIRVDADEVTYPFHIILRFEIEMGLMDGSIDIQDLPKIWNEKMQHYLGVVPETDALGVLQDVHWTGSFGYFPSYTLGAMMAAQLYDAACREMRDLKTQVRSGEFAELNEWLASKIHRKGSLFSSLDMLLEDATGQPLNPEIFVEYLKAKYRGIYDLQF